MARTPPDGGNYLPTHLYNINLIWSNVKGDSVRHGSQVGESKVAQRAWLSELVARSSHADRRRWASQWLSLDIFLAKKCIMFLCTFATRKNLSFYNIIFLADKGDIFPVEEWHVDALEKWYIFPFVMFIDTFVIFLSKIQDKYVTFLQSVSQGKMFG